jgi:ribonuclease HI
LKSRNERDRKKKKEE